MINLNEMKVDGIIPELKRRNPDGSLQTVSENHVNFLNTQNKLASCAKGFSQLSESNRLKLAIDMKDSGNKLFNNSKFSDAMDTYLQALMAYDYTSCNPSVGQHHSMTNDDIIEQVSLPLLCNLAACCFELKEYAKAIRFADQAVTLRKDWPKALYRRGQARLKMGDISDAEKDFLTALELCSEDSEAKQEHIGESNKKSLYSKISNYLIEIRRIKSEERENEKKLKYALQKAFPKQAPSPSQSATHSHTASPSKPVADCENGHPRDSLCKMPVIYALFAVYSFVIILMVRIRDQLSCIFSSSTSSSSSSLSNESPPSPPPSSSSSSQHRGGVDEKEKRS